MISKRLEKTLLNVLENIPESILLLDHWCLVDSSKFPFTIVDQNFAKTSNSEDFTNLELIDPIKIKVKFIGLGILIRYVGAIDIDACVSKPFDVNSISSEALEIIHYFKSYTEFSFSGKGIRILFESKGEYDIKRYYLKNDSLGLEFYTPQQKSPRYVTVTGRRIFSEYSYRALDLTEACEKWMVRPAENNISKEIYSNGEMSEDRLRKRVNYLLLTNADFQENFYLEAPGSGKDESQRDFRMVAFLYSNVTTDPDQIISIFESSNFYKTKDELHMDKWHKRDRAYFWGIYKKISS